MFLFLLACSSGYAQMSVFNGRVVSSVKSALKSGKSVKPVKFKPASLNPPKVPSVPSVSVPSVSSVPGPEALRIQALEQSVQSLRKKNTLLKIQLKQVTSQTALLRATFQAVKVEDIPTNTFSGTVFKTIYNGEEEIFGVVAAHSIGKSAADKSLQRHFTANIFDGENVVEVPAEIVQLSSPSMLDIALVKFSPEAEALFHPLSISEVPVAFNEALSSQGFAGNADVNIPGRNVTQITPLSLRTRMPYAREDRPGLCGSAVVNARQELVGIHTGSLYDKFDARFDTGYATNASFLHTLVEAYHNGGQAAFPLILNGQKIVDLNVDEYISYMTFYDKEGKVVWQKQFDSKFPYTSIKETFEIYNPHSITITTRRAVWNPENPEMILENHTSPYDQTKVTYKYNFETKELTRKAKQTR